MLALTDPYEVTWEKLPDDFVLDNDPVDNINQPPIAAALTESLEIAGRLPANALTTTNYGICATLNGRMVVKAPDWGYVPFIRVARAEVMRSYTPILQGEPPAIVMEFISDTERHEYSSKESDPPGKWFFYEQVLRVPNYAIFEPQTGYLKVYQLSDRGLYIRRRPNSKNRYWISEMSLFLGIWEGTRENRTGYWLRWWDEAGELLLWGSELVARERPRAELEHQRAELEHQRAEQERQRAELERQRVEQLIAQLRAAGIEPEL
ncbi:MAG: Uma2 family endonuclease [Hormoscilla sp. SP12CHS1]|nr:Uma2 family endonuclease [Hormoscilla sp. SP12CHS1]